MENTNSNITKTKFLTYDLNKKTVRENVLNIKSYLYGCSTLLVSGKTTNFIFKIINPKISPLEIEKINSINTPSKIKDRLQEIYKRSDGLRFVKTENSNFGNNLQMIDSSLPLILAEIVHLFYSSSYSNLDELIGNISKVNPIGYDTSGGHPFYKYKIKRFLSDTALGMMPSRVWTGLRDATGGYLVVKEDGEILCYHVYNQNNFEDYLYNNTRLDTASSKRFGFGKIYQEYGGLFFKLNLQIRFIK